MSAPQPQCAGIIVTYRGLARYQRQCSRRATLASGFCKAHDPAEKDSRYAEQQKKWKADWAAKDAAAQKAKEIRQAELRLIAKANDWLDATDQRGIPRSKLEEAIRDLREVSA